MYGKLKVNRGVNLGPLTTTSDLIKGDNMSYEQRALHECLAWQHEIMKKRASIFGRASKSVQNKIRSEERRVGKESRTRRSPDHLRKHKKDEIGMRTSSVN